MTFGLGSSTGSSYRLALRNLLLRQSSGPGGAGPDGLGGVAFPDVNYVGTVRAGRAQGFLDNDCECFSGDVISQLADRGTTAATMFKPNVVLVEVGTNNCNSGRLVPDARANATALIEELLDDSSPGAVAVLATLIVNPVPEQEACRLDVNTQYRQAVADLQRRDRKVLLADMRVPAPGTRDTALSVSDLADGRHPNDFGYNKMANIWYSAILDARDRGWLVDAVAVDGILADGNAGRVEGETAGNGGAMRGISGTNGNGSSVDSDGTGRAGGGGVLLSGGDDDTVIVSGQGPRIPGVGTASAGERLRASVGAAAVGLVVMGLMAL